MPGGHITQKELIALQDSIDSNKAPAGVLKVLSEPEYIAYEEDEFGTDIIAALRSRIFRGIALPSDFPFDEGDLEYFSTIAVLCENLDGVERVRSWVVQTLAEHLNTSHQVIERQLKFQPRAWFDGPVAVSIIADDRGLAQLL